MKKQRGSALLFTLLTSIAATTVILATVGSITQEVQRQRLAERSHLVNSSFDAVANKVVSEFAAGNRELSASMITVAINGGTWNLTLTDNSASKTDSILVSGMGIVNGKVEYGRKVFARPYLESPFTYGLSTMADLNISSSLVVGSLLLKSNVWNEGRVIGTQLFTVNGELRATSTVTNPLVTVTDGVGQNLQTRGLPPLDVSLYASIADRTISGSTLLGFTFAKNYELVYVNGNLKLSGAITGNGTIVAKGDVEFVGDTSYADKTSRAVFLAGGEIRVTGSTANIVGILFSTKKLKIDGGPTVKLEPGIAASLADIELKKRLIIGFDGFLADNPEEGPKYKLPGFWP